MMNMLWQPYSHTKAVKALRAEEQGEKNLQSYQYPTLTDSLHTPPTQICDSSTDKY